MNFLLDEELEEFTFKNQLSKVPLGEIAFENFRASSGMLPLAKPS